MFSLSAAAAWLPHLELERVVRTLFDLGRSLEGPEAHELKALQLAVSDVAARVCVLMVADSTDVASLGSTAGE